MRRGGQGRRLWLGIERVVPALKKIGCRMFFVADIAEGRRVRAAAPEAVIYVLNGLMPGTARRSPTPICGR